ncbi:MAG: hypothetical protein WC849_02810 [Candidatus Paceibacterota bacterium]
MLNKIKKYYLWFLVPVLMVALFVLYQESSIMLSGWKIVKAGSLEIVSPEIGVRVFINENEKEINPRDIKINFKKVPVGMNSIVVAKEDYWPWMKKVEMKEGEKTIIYPFMVQVLQKDIFAIDENSDLYKATKNKIENYFIPNKDKKFVSEDVSATLWVYNNSIFFQRIDSGDVIEVFKGVEAISSVDFYKDRNDVIIFSMGSYIYVIEANTKNNQNFQPLFQGIKPLFAKKDNQKIYIFDQNILAEIKM